MHPKSVFGYCSSSSRAHRSYLIVASHLPACILTAHKLCHSRSMHPIAVECPTVRPITFAQCDRMRWFLVCVPDLWCSSPIPMASSTLTLDSCCPLFQRFSFHFPASNRHRPNVATLEIAVSHAAIFSSMWLRKPTLNIALYYVSLIGPFHSKIHKHTHNNIKWKQRTAKQIVNWTIMVNFCVLRRCCFFLSLRNKRGTERKRDMIKLTFPGMAALMNKASVSGHGSSLYWSHHRLTISVT